MGLLFSWEVVAFLWRAATTRHLRVLHEFSGARHTPVAMRWTAVLSLQVQSFPGQQPSAPYPTQIGGLYDARLALN